MASFDAHPLLVWVLGLLALPLLLDAPRDAVASRGAALGLLLAALLTAPLAWLLSGLLGGVAPSGWAAWPWLAAWLGVAGLPVLMLDAPLGRLAPRLGLWPGLLIWPSCAFWGLFAVKGLPAWLAVLGAGALGALLLTGLRGVLDRFRQNRSPRGLDGLPVRLLTLELLLLIWVGVERWLAGRLP